MIVLYVKLLSLENNIMLFIPFLNTCAKNTRFYSIMENYTLNGHVRVCENFRFNAVIFYFKIAQKPLEDLH